LGKIYFDENSLLIHPDHVVEPPTVEPIPPVTPGGGEGDEGKKGKGVTPPPKKKVPTRYYGRVEIDPQRVHKDMGLIVEEVIQRLSSQMGCDVEITLEIRAERPEGFDESTVRTISENSRTLKFEHYEFEEG
jgi:hypothetical protein